MSKLITVGIYKYFMIKNAVNNKSVNLLPNYVVTAVAKKKCCHIKSDKP